MSEPYPIQKLGEVLPPRARKVLRPVYNTVAHRALSIHDALLGAEHSFHYGGTEYPLCYTRKSATYHRGAVSDGQTREGAPLSYLDVDVERIIDIGAYYGLYTVLLARLNPETPIVAFEPDDHSRQVCQDVVAVNEIGAAVRPQVVAGEAGTVTFYEAPMPGSQGHTLTPTAAHDPVEKDAVTLSDEVADVDSAFVKLDAEGGEWAILRELLPADRRVQGLVELHPDKLPVAVDDVLALLGETCVTVELLAESSPNHPATDDHEYVYNRPIYYIDTGRAPATDT